MSPIPPALDATSENSAPSYAPAADQQQSTTTSSSNFPNSNSTSASVYARKKTPSPTHSIIGLVVLFNQPCNLLNFIF